MKITVKTSRASGAATAPPSKSMAHRYLICAALSEGKSRIANLSFSEDILATIDCLRGFGTDVKVTGTTVEVAGIANRKKQEETKYLCRESGSTLRFFLPIAMMAGEKSVFYGSTRLLERPQSVYEDICAEQGIEFLRKADSIVVNGKLFPGTFRVRGDVSSQFISGLLFVLPLLDSDSEIQIITPIESLSYINLTMEAMREFGVDAEWKNENVIRVRGNQEYNGRELAVEGDYSNAAFLDAFNSLGGNVTVQGLKKDSLQGDRVYAELFKALEERQQTIDISDCPDLGPILFVIAAAHQGAVFTGTKRLEIKESSRGKAMCEELAKFGVFSVSGENSIEIKKSFIHKPVETINGHNDHRIVMAMTVLLSVTGGTLDGAEAVKKSYPDYFYEIKKLGIEVCGDGMVS